MREWRGTIIQAIAILSIAALGFRDPSLGHIAMSLLGAIAANAVARGRIDSALGMSIPPPSSGGGGLRIEVPPIPRAPTGLSNPPPAAPPPTAHARAMLARDQVGAMIFGGVLGALLWQLVGL